MAADDMSDIEDLIEADLAIHLKTIDPKLLEIIQQTLKEETQ